MAAGKASKGGPLLLAITVFEFLHLWALVRLRPHQSRVSNGCDMVATLLDAVVMVMVLLAHYERGSVQVRS